jgi:hypothetical protein
MIIVQITGGLGNQLFQYALGRALAEKSGDKLLLDISSYSWDKLRKYELSPFLINASIAKVEDIEFTKSSKITFFDRLFLKIFGKEIPYYRKAFVKEPSFSFDINFSNYRTSNVYLEGYWQSENYFSFIRSQLLKEIWCDENKFSKKFIDYKKVISQSSCSISIHVRRGDYVSNSETTAFHGLCDLDYYLNAIHLIEQTISNPFYYVFSDDKEYVREIFGSMENVCFIEKLSFDFEEMFLMSLCKHNIIANSSFSWWGAWLNQHEDKKVIAPKKWFNDPLMQLQTKDILPDCWCKI